ncbi:glutamate receptor ionotropic, kainate 4 [Plakobranchus ocellatus]|uniref:Glutamate receptor ionotropic, kainate 4 n=1 Tax=Plakobranchus ocellatus TaxID=259542 RepID=A0AAV4BHE6_9GAST|nr:glutamate receptor ionotropic, kainate 4 [Plakobranchus ocellatus]
MWTRLFLEVQEVIDYMYDSHKPNQSSIPVKSETLLLLYTAEISKVVDRIEKSREFPNRTSKTIAFEIDIPCARQKVLEVLLTFVKVETEINGVIVASSNADCVASVFDTVTTESMIKWRRFLHITEWIALLVDPPYFNADFTPFQQISLPDFVTPLFIRGRSRFLELNVAQKSRTKQMGSGPQLRLNLTLTPTKNSLFHDSGQSPFPNQTLQSTLNHSILSDHNIRKNAASFLSTQKSVMAGMIIPVVLLVSTTARNAFPVTEGGETAWTGFSVEILNLLSKALGFTSLPFAVTDGGFYGMYEADGDALGLVGYLTRREAGLTTTPMFLSERRRQDIDFLYPYIRETQTYVMFKPRSGIPRGKEGSDEEMRLTDNGCRRRLQNCKPEEGEGTEMYIVRIKTYQNQWIELSQTKKTFEDMRALFDREQFMDARPVDLAVYITEKVLRDLQSV